MMQDPDRVVTKRVKASLSRMPLGVKFAVILVVTLLLPGVTSKSIRRSVETAVTPSPSVAEVPKADHLEKEAALEKHELESNEIVTDSSEMGLVPFDDSLNYDATENNLLAEEKATDTLPEKTEETNEEMATSFEEDPKTETEANTVEGGDPADLDDDDDEDDNDVTEDEIAKAAELMNFIVKRAAEEGDKVGELQANSMDVDNFQFSDFPKLIEPFVQALSGGSSEKEAPEVPSEDDFFFWFPAVKKFLEFAIKESNAARPTGVPTNSTAKPARRSGFSAPSEPSRQIAPAATPSSEPEVVPVTLQDVFVTPVLPTIAEPLSAIQRSLSDDAPDSEESFVSRP